MLDDPGSARWPTSSACATGCQLSIDDYGTGYSSLSYVRQMPVQELKIDRSFVMNLLTQPDDEIIVRADDRAYAQHGPAVTPRASRPRPCFRRAWGVGCDRVQGYFIGKPMAAVDLVAWMDGSPWARGGHHGRAGAEPPAVVGA